MPTKGEKATAEVTILKVGAPRTFGDGGKTFSIVTDETGLAELGGVFEIEVYNEDGAKAAEAAKGKKIPVEVEFSNEYQGTMKWKLTKLPGWERGTGRGRSGNNWSPEREARERASTALHAAAVACGPLLTQNPTDVEPQIVVTMADAFLDWLNTKIKETVPQVQQQAQASDPSLKSGGDGVGDPKNAPWEALRTALRGTVEVFKANGLDVDSEWVKSTVLAPIVQANGIGGLVKEGLTIPQMQLLESELKAAQQDPGFYKTVAGAQEALT